VADRVGKEFLPEIKPRPSESHKGSFGSLLVIAGSRGYTGAAALASMAALRAGAGLVTLACPDSVNDILEVKLTEVITRPVRGDGGGTLAAGALDQLLAMREKFDALAVGPGLGLNDETRAVVRGVLSGCPKPVTVDADGLNALVGDLDVLSKVEGPVVLTPHPGEMSRLTGVASAEIVANPERTANDFAAEHGVVVALKKHATVVADGTRVFVNDTGNPGMATAGSGDVLTGVIGALLAQGLSAFEAAALAVHLHGWAGDLARDAKGEVSLIASDLLDYLPAAFVQYLEMNRKRPIGF